MRSRSIDLMLVTALAFIAIALGVEAWILFCH